MDISPASDFFAPDVDERYVYDNHAASSNVKPTVIADNLSQAANNIVASAETLDMSLQLSLL